MNNSSFSITRTETTSTSQHSTAAPISRQGSVNNANVSRYTAASASPPPPSYVPLVAFSIVSTISRQAPNSSVGFTNQAPTSAFSPQPPNSEAPVASSFAPTVTRSFSNYAEVPAYSPSLVLSSSTSTSDSIDSSFSPSILSKNSRLTNPKVHCQTHTRHLYYLFRFDRI